MKIVQGVPRYGYDELQAMPTITVGQADDLKHLGGLSGRPIRIWLSRCGVRDGEPFEHTATVELKRGTNGWRTLYQYDADHPMTIKEVVA